MGAIRRIALALVIVGALNWGLIGIFNFDLVATLFGGQDSAWSRIVYTLVGISGLVCLTLLFKPDEEMEPATTNRSFRNANLNTELGDEPDFQGFRSPKEQNSVKNDYQGPSNNNKR